MQGKHAAALVLMVVVVVKLPIKDIYVWYSARVGGPLANSHAQEQALVILAVTRATIAHVTIQTAIPKQRVVALMLLDSTIAKNVLVKWKIVRNIFL